MASRRKNSNLTFGLFGGEGGAEAALHERLAKSHISVRTGIKEEEQDKRPSLTKSILNVLNGSGNSTIERLSFDVDPSDTNSYAGVYKRKLRLLPDEILKRIAIQDSLVSNIVRARQNHVSAFGRPRPDRFSTGFEIKANPGVIDSLDEAGKKKLNEQIERAVKLVSTCGHTEGVDIEDLNTFSEYLSLSTRSAVVNGRIATEIIWLDDESAPEKKKFHRWLAADAGTIYHATNDHSSQESVRDTAYHLISQLAGKKFKEETYNNGDYRWVQVINGKPQQVFTSNEMKVYNFYAVPDVELDGYPVTPLDTVISAIVTHTNITAHNRLYFQSGRASRGMLVIKSDDVNPTVIHNIKQQFNASINNVNNSWRMPVFGCGMGEEISWSPIDTGGGRDMEFQYLTDLNAREILTAFMMSPDELPGWSYLSRGTNNQALSESNNEYKIQAARDVGIRPLIHSFEDFVNSHLLPLIDADLAKRARLKLVGLDADNPEKEAVRIQQDSALWETYDGILGRVEKKPIGRKWGGTLPLNPTIKSYWDQYFTVGEILAEHCDRPEAAKNPKLAYRRDPFFFQWLQFMQADAQMQMQQQQAAAAAGQSPQGGGGGPPQGGGGSPQGGDGDSGGDSGSNPPASTEKQKTDASQEASASPSGDATELARSIDMAFEAMSKAEQQLPAEKRRVLAQRRATVDRFMRGWLTDADEAVAEIMKVAEHHAPRRK